MSHLKVIHGKYVNSLFLYSKCRNSCLIFPVVEASDTQQVIQGGPKVGVQYIVYSMLYMYFWPTLYDDLVSLSTLNLLAPEFYI